MKTAKLFRHGKSQAVQLPKEFRFKGEKVFIKKIGNATILLSIENQNPWEPLFNSLKKFSPNFMESREQPKPQVFSRSSFEN